MRTILAAAVVFGSGWLCSSGLAQDESETPNDPPAVAVPLASPPDVEKVNERPDLTPAQFRELAATLKINEVLNQETELDVLEVPLKDVLMIIAEKHKIPIVLDPEGLEVAKVTPDEIITLDIEDISLRNVLRALLKPLHLGFVVRHEVLTITALDCPERLATVRTFPLGDLVKRMDDPSELITTLEIIWPEGEGRLGEERTATPRARILANHLVVRGSPRHLDLAELLIDGLKSERPPEPEVSKTIPLPDSLRPAFAPREPARAREPAREPATRPRFREPSPEFRDPFDTPRQPAPRDKPNDADVDEAQLSR